MDNPAELDDLLDAADYKAADPGRARSRGKGDFALPYSPMTEADKEAMLAVIGVGSVDELFADIPESIRLQRPLNFPKGMAEAEVRRHLEALAGQKRRRGPRTRASSAPARTTT